jgi:hypothetical protein
MKMENGDILFFRKNQNVPDWRNAVITVGSSPTHRRRKWGHSVFFKKTECPHFDVLGLKYLSERQLDRENE